jgi:hypothetical protein
MPSRRGFLGATTTAILGITVPARAASADGPGVEPLTALDFEDVCDVQSDVSGHGVASALAKLGWETGASPTPILVVHPSNLVWAVASAQCVGNVVAVIATQKFADIDTWFVAWRGRRVGSQGA